MARKGATPEKIIGLLRQAEVELAQGKTVGEICRGMGISEASYYRWRAEYGGLKLDQARRLKELERENARLRKAVAELTLDKLILKEAAEGNFQAPSVVVPGCGMCVRRLGYPNVGRAARWARRAPPSAACRQREPTRRP